MESSYGRNLEEFQAGEKKIHEPAKTITESDKNLLVSVFRYISAIEKVSRVQCCTADHAIYILRT